jgi:hypothetical protein
LFVLSFEFCVAEERFHAKPKPQNAKPKAQLLDAGHGLRLFNRAFAHEAGNRL